MIPFTSDDRLIQKHVSQTTCYNTNIYRTVFECHQNEKTETKNIFSTRFYV